ncbi:hypothetical protein J4E93_009821 [Alternaria ventricosa]|uniref:uncharacterized protein n=1 Tax=Alternaria ventricosa TaxID=1187951 RepID=UPI0020C251DB|nr:uncharacterized protein J4E93_009821 [Alternaria ventricosa]KAI4638793.1 hypothetical protein J4E93_009821 [Alternaria ventricosa]
MSSEGLTEGTLRGTAIGLMVVTTAVVLARAILRSDQKKVIQWDELWLMLGYLLFMAVTSVYINKTSLLFRLLAVQEGRLAPYPNVLRDGLDAQKTFFFTSPGLWLTLWSIKFSLLAFYKRIMAGTLLLSILLHITACGHSPASWFIANGCGADNVRKSAISFWEGFAVDLTTDLMSKSSQGLLMQIDLLMHSTVMLLPIGLIRNLQIPLARKIQIGGLFALGILVIIASIIRVIQVGATTSAGNTTPSLTWLALWSIIESSVAIIVGCGPGLYRKAKAVYSTTQVHAYNSRGYTKTTENRRTGTKGNTDDEYGLPLKTMSIDIVGPGDVGGSEEELVGQETGGGIRVTRSVVVSH